MIILVAFMFGFSIGYVEGYHVDQTQLHAHKEKMAEIYHIN